MISRREKLLIRPWEQKRYENHLRKVKSAGPAIDDRPPADRVHVLNKLKKQQKENERCDKIEKDNFILMQRLRKIMSTNRVDNYWTTAQPSFLNRVELYSVKPKPVQYATSSSVITDIKEKTRREKCYACTPKIIKGPIIPEERIPWDPPRQQISQKRSQSLPPHSRIKLRQSSAPVTIKEPLETVPVEENIKKSKSASRRRKKSRPESNKMSSASSTNSILFCRGDVQLSVNFPPDTLVKMKEGQTEKFLMRGDCHCRAINVH